MPDFSGTDKTSFACLSTSSTGVQGQVALPSQRPVLVNIFEMVPPVQRMQNHSRYSYLNHFPPSTQFRIPWTGGNPKRIRRANRPVPVSYSDVTQALVWNRVVRPPDMSEIPTAKAFNKEFGQTIRVVPGCGMKGIEPFVAEVFGNVLRSVQDRDTRRGATRHSYGQGQKRNRRFPNKYARSIMVMQVSSGLRRTWQRAC